MWLIHGVSSAKNWLLKAYSFTSMADDFALFPSESSCMICNKKMLAAIGWQWKLTYCYLFIWTAAGDFLRYWYNSSKPISATSWLASHYKLDTVQWAEKPVFPPIRRRGSTVYVPQEMGINSINFFQSWFWVLILDSHSKTLPHN